MRVDSALNNIVINVYSATDITSFLFYLLESEQNVRNNQP